MTANTRESLCLVALFPAGREKAPRRADRTAKLTARRQRGRDRGSALRHLGPRPGHTGPRNRYPSGLRPPLTADAVYVDTAAVLGYPSSHASRARFWRPAARTVSRGGDKRPQLTASPRDPLKSSWHGRRYRLDQRNCVWLVRPWTRNAALVLLRDGSVSAHEVWFASPRSTGALVSRRPLALRKPPSLQFPRALRRSPSLAPYTSAMRNAFRCKRSRRRSLPGGAGPWFGASERQLASAGSGKAASVPCGSRPCPRARL